MHSFKHKRGHNLASIALLLEANSYQVPLQKVLHPGAACSVAVKLLDLDPQGRWFDPPAVGPLSKALNPTLLQGECLLLSLINCKSLWIKASDK